MIRHNSLILHRRWEKLIFFNIFFAGSWDERLELRNFKSKLWAFSIKSLNIFLFKKKKPQKINKIIHRLFALLCIFPQWKMYVNKRFSFYKKPHRSFLQSPVNYMHYSTRCKYWQYVLALFRLFIIRRIYIYKLHDDSFSLFFFIIFFQE